MNDATQRQLKIFCLVVQLGSFYACARALNISNVTINSHVKKLEKVVGHKLFKRNLSESSSLTQEGEKVYLIASRILSNLAMLVDDSIYKNTRRELKLTLDPFSLQILRKNIVFFQKENPEIDIQYELEACSYPEIKQQLIENKVDIGYFYASEDFYDEDSEFICHVPLGIYVDNKHPLADKTVVSIEELSNYSILKMSKNNYLSSLLNQVLKQAGIFDLPVAIETDNGNIFMHSLKEESAVTCLFQWVEATEYKHKLKKVNLPASICSIQMRRIVRAPFTNDKVVKEAIESFTSSLPKP